ncbi:MAG: hypothetical protein E7666_06900 [Ruminococcaceae bacterium]|nr:hypothetical protein [Oscillospiraceae bacterium]
MTYRNIFDSAVAQIAEKVGSYDVSDYEERAGYILASFCAITADADKRYRAANRLPAVTQPETACVDLDSVLTLHTVFAPVAAYYLAANLTADENEAMSDRFFALYSDAISLILSTLPCSSSSISDVYGLM